MFILASPLQELLKACGRSHTLLDVHTSLDYIQQAGVPNWSLDLISGLPHLTIDMWQESLSQAAACAPDHISVYDLQVCVHLSADDMLKPGGCAAWRSCACTFHVGTAC